MRFPRQRGSTSVMVRVFIPDNSVTNGAGLAGLTSGSTNLAIAYSRELQNGFTQITGANLVTITTIGTWANPGTGKLGFKAVDATNGIGLYEIQFPDDAAAFGTGDTSRNVIINVLELTTTALKIGPNMVAISLVPWNDQDGVRLGLTALPNAAAAAIGGLLTAPTTANVGLADLSRILGTALTETAGLLAGGFKKFFNVATPTGTLNSIPDAVAGATGGLFIAGTNAATTITTGLTATFTGDLTGSVGSVTGAVGSVTARVTANTDQLAGQTVTAAAGVTFPASVASPTNITAGTITTTTNLTNLPSIPANWLTAAGIAAAALNGKGDWNIGKTGYTLTTNVWDEVLASHLTAGSTGAALNAAGAAGDPWTTALPGAYGAGTAGNIIGNRIDLAISTRLATSGYTAPDNTGITAIKAKTDNITFTVSAQVDTNIRSVNGVAVTGDGSAGTPWGP